MILKVPYANLAFCAAVFTDNDLYEHQIGTMFLLRSRYFPTEDVLTTLWKPAHEMWYNYPAALLWYFNTLVLEWNRRKYAPIFFQVKTTRDTVANYLPDRVLNEPYVRPGWLGWGELHVSHRNIMKRFAPHYRRIWPEEPYVRPLLFPQKVPEVGTYLVQDDQAGLIIDKRPTTLEVLVRGKQRTLIHEDVERRRWLIDTLPVHERLELEYGTGTFGE